MADLTSEISRANEARQILDAPIFQAAMKDLDEQMKNLRRAVPIIQTEMHTRLVLMEQLKGYLESYFEQIALTGKMAAIQLEQEEQRRSLVEQGLLMFKKLGRNA